MHAFTSAHTGTVQLTTLLLTQLATAVLMCVNNYSLPNVGGNLPPNWVWVMFVIYGGIEDQE